MIKAAVLGSPIAHSLSPLLHMSAYRELGVEADYQALDLPLDRAKSFFGSALSEGWRGFSLTMPLKESVFDSGFEIDPIALRMRSVNTLVSRGDHFYGTSTDRSAFKRLISEKNYHRVAILGGGGTARAALSALDSEHTSIDFLLRSQSRSESLEAIADYSRIDYFGMDHDISSYDLVISTLPSQAESQVAVLLKNFKGLFFDVLYHPYPTEALRIARSAGLETFDGIDLLVEQALDQIKIFSEVDFDFDAMRQRLLKVARNFLSSE